MAWNEPTSLEAHTTALECRAVRRQTGTARMGESTGQG